jgi:levansucrase
MEPSLSVGAGASLPGRATDCLRSFWTQAHIEAIAAQPLPETGLIAAADAAPLLDGFDLWDLWPLQLEDGSVAKIAGGELWMILSAPRLPDPGMRHDVARTRLLHRVGEAWRDCGNLFPDGLNPGSREWSGSALYDPESGRVSAYFTAAGRSGDGAKTFEQRLFQTHGLLDLSGSTPVVGGWSDATPIVVNDGSLYADVVRDPGVPGRIKGFRDPYWFRDPESGARGILFTGSATAPDRLYDGVVGLALEHASNGHQGFALAPPIFEAPGLVGELERPHILFRDGGYYLFWSSQGSVFAPDGPKAPTGLYGAVAPSLFGPYELLNDTGLVICNPVSEPRQAYCWQVLPTLDVVSFVDHWGLEGRDIAADPALNRAQFGGTIAPMIKIEINGSRTRIVKGGA